MSFLNSTGRDLAAHTASENEEGICFYFCYTSREGEHTENLMKTMKASLMKGEMAMKMLI